MAKHNDMGRMGEDFAARYLAQQGYDIMERDWQQGSRDLDIIARTPDGITVVFVEVKTRRSIRCGTPAESVHYRKRQKIVQTAYWYLRANHAETHLCRFDVIEVYAMDSGWNVHHIKNAFEA